MTEYWQRVALASLDGLSIGKTCDHGKTAFNRAQSLD